MDPAEGWQNLASVKVYQLTDQGKTNEKTVAVSGGKDSHFQVWMLKEVMHMNPILFSVEDNFPMTQAASTTSRTSARSSAVRSSPASPTSRCKRR